MKGHTFRQTSFYSIVIRSYIGTEELAKFLQKHFKSHNRALKSQNKLPTFIYLTGLRKATTFTTTERIHQIFLNVFRTHLPKEI